MRLSLPCLAAVALVPLSAPMRTMNIQYHVFGTRFPRAIKILEAAVTSRVQIVTLDCHRQSPGF